MSSLSLKDFPAFFSAVNGGAAPYAWQVELVARIAEEGWPEQIIAPTGSGKSAVIEAHLFSLALAVREGRRLPRRLALCVSRRAIVDAQAARARALRDQLSSPADPVVREVAIALNDLGGERLGVSLLRGGELVDTSWLDDPVGCHVLCTTPDMLGSRVLFQGYRSTPASRARAAGLLAYDTVVVIDEAHLNRQLTHTLHRVAELAACSPLSGSVPVLRVVETTATPADQRPDALIVNGAHDDERLAVRLGAPKTLKVHRLPSWPATGGLPARRKHYRSIVPTAIEMRRAAAGTIGLFVNTVADALAAGSELRASGLTVRTLIGPMRPVDRRRLDEENPGLLTVDGDDTVDVLVATQTIEVGVDLDLHGIITDLAPGSSLVQRLGRANRRGLRSECPVVVLCPAEGEPIAASGPYVPQDLEAACDWLAARGDGADLSASQLVKDPAPIPTLPRLLLSRLEPAEAELLAATSEDLVSTPDLTLWLSDELSRDEMEIGIVGRRLPSDPVAAEEFVACLPPQTHEIYPSSVVRGTDLLRSLDGTTVILVRGGSTSSWMASDLASTVQAGDTVVIDSSTRAAIDGVIVVGDHDAGPVGDVFVEQSFWAERPTPSVFVHTQAVSDELTTDDLSASDDRILDAIGSVIDANDLEDPSALLDEATDAHSMLMAGLDDSPSALRRWVAMTTIDRSQHDEIPWIPVLTLSTSRTLDGAPVWAAIVWESVSSLDGEARQLGSNTPVHLDSHQADVAARAEQFGTALDLPQSAVEALREAGLHHDDGKRALWFQEILHDCPLTREQVGSASFPLLAKSGRTSVLAARGRARSSLPRGWRHEQLSVVLAWDAVSVSEHDLAIRLIGTSHGRGRSTFRHGSNELLEAGFLEHSDLAAQLFDSGSWDSLIESTTATWGLWACAFLEAVLRAADISISKEGR